MRWRGFALSGIATGLCLWLAYGAITVGLAGYHEMNGRGDRALRWRPDSPTALALETERLIAVQDYEAADKAARAALARTSLEAGALRSLALSASARGRADEAQALMERAVRVNPRDISAQAWLFDRAMARGDFRNAVLHADILMRRSPQARVALSTRLALGLANEGVRTTLANRLSLDPPWRNAFIAVASRRGRDSDVAALFGALNRAGSPVQDEEAAAFFSRLIAEGKYRQAKDYFDRLVSRNGEATFVYDGNFEGRPGPAPLNWTAWSTLGGSARWRSSDDTPLGSLQVSHDGFSSSSALAGQLILVPPGRYALSARARIEDPIADGRFRLQIVCAGGPQLVAMTLAGAPGSWKPSKVEFTVPPEGCAAQWLQVIPVTGDRREIADMSIDDIAVRRLGGAPSANLGSRSTP